MRRLRPTGAGVVELLPDVRQATPARQLHILMSGMLRRLFGRDSDGNDDTGSSIGTAHIPATSLKECATEPGIYVAEQDLTGYKAVTDGVAEVTVPEGAPIVSPDTTGGRENKLRTDEMEIGIMHRCKRSMKARVNGLNGRPEDALGKPMYRAYSIVAGQEVGYWYATGRTYTESKLSTDINKYCTTGLHLFATLESAVKFFYANRN